MKKVLAGPVVLALGYQLDPRVQVEHCESPQMMEIVKKCPSLSNGFFPTPWLFNGVLQGIFGMGPGSSKNRRGNTDFVEYSREFFLMKDGGIMSVDWKEPRVHSKNVLLIIPGLSGGSGSEYVRTAVNQAHCAGFDVGVIHGRGIAGTPLKSCKVHHLCAFDDIREVIKKIQKKYPERQLFGLGTSMGAGLILRYAMDTGDKCLFKAIVAVAAPFDYISCRAKLNSFWPYFGFADGFIVKSLKKQFNSVSAHLLMMKEDLDRMGIDMERVKDFNTSKEFDEEFTVKMVGYKSTQDYYEDASVGYDLSKIKVPTLSLNSEDDPIVPFKKDSARQITSNPLVLLAYTRVGGHIGFYTGWSPKRWYPAPCLEFLLACSP